MVVIKESKEKLINDIGINYYSTLLVAFVLFLVINSLIASRIASEILLYWFFSTIS